MIWPLLLATRIPLLPVIARSFSCEIAGVQGHLHVDHAHQPHVRIEYRDIGSPNLLALNVQLAIRHRQRVYDIGRAHHSAGERLWEH